MMELIGSCKKLRLISYLSYQRKVFFISDEDFDVVNYVVMVSIDYALENRIRVIFGETIKECDYVVIYTNDENSSLERNKNCKNLLNCIENIYPNKVCIFAHK